MSGTTGTLPVKGDDSDTDTDAAAGGKASATGESRMLTQEEVDRIVKDRLERQKKQTAEQLAKYADYDDVKKRLAELETASLSETERQQKRLTELETEAANERAQRIAAETKAQTMAIRVAVVSAAMQANFTNPDDAYNLIDSTGIKVEGDKVEGVEEAVQALAQSKPYLLRKGSSVNLNAAPAGASSSELPRLTPDEQRIAHAMGVSEEAYAKRKAESQPVRR